jgi:hypothetical protein
MFQSAVEGWRGSAKTFGATPDDATTTLISEHADIVAGIAEGRRVIKQDDFDYAYSLHTADEGCKVATFAEGRIGYREWARRSGYIHSIDDRYDHDVDELLVR